MFCEEFSLEISEIDRQSWTYQVISELQKLQMQNELNKMKSKTDDNTVYFPVLTLILITTKAIKIKYD